MLIDIGGVLLRNHWSEVAQVWGERLAISPETFMAALFGGNEDAVLIGRLPESEWWEVVRGRLGLSHSRMTELQCDLEARESWDEPFVHFVRSIRGRVPTGIVSNTWPSTRERMRRRGLLDMVDEIILSCEVGCAKPDPRIFEIALGRITLPACELLFVDDTVGHVAAAESLGMAGHVHSERDGTIALIERFLDG